MASAKTGYVQVEFTGTTGIPKGTKELRHAIIAESLEKKGIVKILGKKAGKYVPKSAKE